MSYRLQPIFNLKDNSIHSYELLYAGVGGPSKVKDWVKQDVIMFEDYITKAHVKPGTKPRLNVNLTSKSIHSISDDLIRESAKKFKLVLEWTEELSKEVSNESCAEKLNSWRKRFGVTIAIDDAGKGQCFLEKISLIEKPDLVKLDGDLFRKSLTCERHRRSVDTIIDCCQSKYFPPIDLLAEWIESEQELEFARDVLKVQYGQGFYLDNMLNSHDEIILPVYEKKPKVIKIKRDYPLIKSINIPSLTS